MKIINNSSKSFAMNNLDRLKKGAFYALTGGMDRTVPYWMLYVCATVDGVKCLYRVGSMQLIPKTDSSRITEVDIEIHIKGIV